MAKSMDEFVYMYSSLNSYTACKGLVYALEIPQATGPFQFDRPLKKVTTRQHQLILKLKFSLNKVELKLAVCITCKVFKT